MEEFWREPSLYRFVRRAAQINGAGEAVRARTFSMTWFEFASRTEAISGGLRALGLISGDRVALVSENTYQSLLAWFSLLHAGCIVVPINIRLSKGEITSCIADAEAKAVMISADQVTRLDLRTMPHCVRAIVALDDARSIGFEHDLESLCRTSPAEAGSTEAGGQDLAAIYYTGGTTGGPKGVMLSHANLVANTMNVAGPLGFSASTRYLHAAPMFHVLETAGIFGVTAMAGCHHFVPKFDASAIVDVIGAEAISVTALVPTMIGSLVNVLEGTASLGSLETLFYGGTAIPEALLSRLRIVLPKTRLVQGYGQTETSPTVTLLLDQDHVVGNPRSRSCGVAVPSVELALRTPDGTFARSRATGEICVRGATVMRGYWKRPLETEVALEDGWLRTGDAGRMDDKGYLYIVDRLKDFIKTGGENVSPTEVENAIHLHSDVVECSVFGQPSERWGEEIVAVIFVRPHSSIDEAGIRTHLKKYIASFKIPKAIQFTAEPLPKSGPGKILRRAVREGYQKQQAIIWGKQ